MTAASRTVYTGDGVIKQFNISFPFISSAHLMIFVNEALQLTPMHYTLSGSTVTFNDAPEQDAAIEFKRNTSPLNILVDFTNGSVLNESDLDTAYLHNFYLMQEVTDGFNQLINEALIDIATGAGILETETDAVIAALVNEMLTQSAAASLQQRVNDIDTNAEAIVQLGTDLQVQVNTIAQGTAAIVYVQASEPVPGVGGIPDPILDGARWYDSDDNNKPYIYDQGATAWVSLEDPRVGVAVANITVLQADVGTNAAAVVTEQTARVNGDNSIATDLALLGAANGGDTAFILDLDTVEVVAGVETLANRFSTLSAADSTNATSITTEQSARIAADAAEAALRVILAARVTTTEGDISTNAAQIITEAATAASASGANASNITALLATVDLRNRVFAQAAQPTADNVGDLWIETDNSNKLWRWDGATWLSVQDAGISANASAITATDAQVSTNEGNISSQAGSISTLQANVTTAQSGVDTNAGGIVTVAADLVTEEGVRATADSAEAALRVTLAARVTTSEGDIDTAEVNITANATATATAQGDADTLMAKYGVTLNVNGYVTGFAQNNDGSTGTFVILADKFAVVDPTGDPGETEYVPFQIVGGKVRFNADVEIDGDLVVSGTINGSAMINGTIGSTQIGANAITTTQINANAVTANKIEANAITADKILAGAIDATKIATMQLSAISADLGAITAGTITLDSAGHIKGGQTAFFTGTGFFLGYESSIHKFSIGNQTDFISWDGTSLIVRGNVSVGAYVDSTSVILLQALVVKNSVSDQSYNEVKKFEINRGGTVRVYVTKKLASTSGGVVTNGKVRVKVDGSVKQTWDVTTSGYTTSNSVITLGSNAAFVTIEVQSGVHDTMEPLPTITSVKDVYLKATKTDGEKVITD